MKSKVGFVFVILKDGIKMFAEGLMIFSLRLTEEVFRLTVEHEGTEKNFELKEFAAVRLLLRLCFQNIKLNIDWRNIESIFCDSRVKKILKIPSSGVDSLVTM